MDYPAIANNVAALAMAVIFILYLQRRDSVIGNLSESITKAHVESISAMRSLEHCIDKLRISLRRNRDDDDSLGDDGD